MHLDIHQAIVPLVGPMPLRLAGARGTRVRSLAGTLWVTVDGQQQDRLLERGESLVIDSDCPVLVSPLAGNATVGLCEAEQPAPHGLAAWLQRLRPAQSQAAAA